MRRLALAMASEPTLQEIRCDRWAWSKIRWYLDAERWVNQAWFGAGCLVRTAVNLNHRSAPGVIDGTLAIGQWKAFDTRG